MSTETRCRGCGVILTIASEHAGKRARCPRCRVEYVVPDQTDLPGLDSVCHYCGAAVPRGEQPDATFKTCAACRESIEQNQRELVEQREGQGRRRRGQLISFLLLVGLLKLLGMVMKWLGQ